MGLKQPRLVSVIVVNYNGEKHLADCLQSILKSTYGRREIVVVDNGSSDASRAILTDLALRHPDLIPILSPRNLGYAGAVNLAMDTTRGSYLAVLNMDVTVTPRWLQPLIECLERHPNVGAVCPMVLLTDRRHVNAAGQDIHVTGLGFNRGLGQLLDEVGRDPVSVSGIQGAAFVVSRSLLEKTGGLDASGFLYHEDVNFSWLLRLLGLDLVCVPESVVHHDYILSMHPEKLHLLERNRWAMLLTYLRPSTLLLLSPFLGFTELLMWSYCLWRGWAFLKSKTSACAWVLRHRRQIRERRRWAKKMRARSDRDVLKHMHWRYAWSQFLILGRERAVARRQVVGGVSKETAKE